MATWVYLATAAQAGQAATVNFALTHHVIYRPARNSVGNRVPRVGDLQPGDRILLAYRQPNAPPIVHLCGRIAPVNSPVPGTQVIERITLPLAQQLFNAGYEPVAPDSGEVIHLEEVHTCQFQLQGSYLGQNAIRELEPQDHGVVEACPSCRLEAAAKEPTPSTATTVSNGANTVSPSAQLRQHASTRDITPTGPFGGRARFPGEFTGRVFDSYVMVDWSSKGTPATGRDSIWMGWGEWQESELSRHTANPKTRRQAIDELRAMLARFLDAGKRTLVGFDFAFGYPQGFVGALELQEPGWSGLLWHFGNCVTDDERNQHNRDAFATQCNEKIGGGPGPFWGCPTGAACANLTTRRVGIFDFPYHGLGEYRATERVVRQRGINVQSVWKLNQGVSVGGQTILGLKYLHELRWQSAPELVAALRVWPLETGWDLPEEARVIVAEIFPSVLTVDDGLEDCVNDQAQVLTCVRHAAWRDAAGQLAPSFRQPVGASDEEQRIAMMEEGWILFV